MMRWARLSQLYVMAWFGGTPEQRIAAQAATPPLPQWTLSAMPTLEINDDGTPGKSIDRVGGVARLASGEIVALDGASQELRIFSGKGKYLRTWSGAGSGPGALQGAQWLSQRGDTVWVMEPMTRRMSAFAAPRGFVSQVVPRARNEQLVMPVARLDGGQLLVTAFRMRGVNAPAGSVVRDSVKLGLVSAVTAAMFAGSDSSLASRGRPSDPRAILDRRGLQGTTTRMRSSTPPAAIESG